MGFLRFCRPASVPVCLPGGAALTGPTDSRSRTSRPGKAQPPPGEITAQPEMSLFALCVAGPQRLAGLQLLC
ncbi:hypothetical protein FPK85_19970 [Acinetobacter baumannii]|nr:hypothetical protein [Acinetobacter baumannii]